MLLRCGVKNFYSFKEGVEISFELSKSCPVDISKGKHISNIICVKGANGSGKTNLLKIISFLKFFCADSFSEKPEMGIPVNSFFNNNDPIDIYCDFKIEDVKFTYNASITKKEIICEKICRGIKRLTPIITRNGNTIEKCIKEFSDLNKVILRSNASVISTAFQYEIKEIKGIYLFFRRILSNVTYIGRTNFDDFNRVSKYYHDTKNVFKFTLDIIKKIDLGIKDVSIKTRKGEKDDLIYFPVFEHDTCEKNNKLTFYEQSSGTKELFMILPNYAEVLINGGLLVLDEFDINLHPDILPFLIGLFDNRKINLNNAQLIFSTHHSYIIDYMGKYRTILVNKDESESYAYRLDEIEGDILRNDRLISPIYKEGKIGGVPRVTMYGKEK
jgi:AAA15 family ATPase/GTPase